MMAPTSRATGTGIGTGTGAQTGTGAVVVPLSRRRSAIARHMRASLAASAQLTCGVRVGLDEVMAVRAAAGHHFREATGIALSPLAFVARATCLALRDMPLFNSTFDAETGARTEHEQVNLGIAVDTEDGLVVANLKHADRLHTAELALGIAAMAEKVRAGKTRIEDVTGGTFTLSNTGSRGSTFDTPILNWPEVGIIAVPVVQREPRWEDGEGSEDGGRFVPEWSTVLCLTYDHQVADGADAARFLQRVGSYLATWKFADEIGKTAAVSARSDIGQALPGAATAEPRP